LVVLFSGCAVTDDDSGPVVIDDTGKEDGGTSLRSNVNVALGVPNDHTYQDDLLIARTQYVNSYNQFRNGPNWVAWRLTASDVGPVPRQTKFKPDPALPSTMFHVTTDDYANQQFDRGHMCDSEDRSDVIENNQATFYMSNVLPQLHELNAGPWQGLEIYSRTLAASGSDLYIVSGGIYSEACNTHVERAGNQPTADCTTIGARKGESPANGIVVPESTWKVIVVVPAGTGASGVTPDSRVIAVIMPNVTTDATQDWTPYVTTVDAIEDATGYHFFGYLPTSVRSALRTQMPAPMPGT
jgi:endonuclease G